MRVCDTTETMLSAEMYALAVKLSADDFMEAAEVIE